MKDVEREIKELGKKLHKLGIKIGKADYYRIKEQCERTGRSPEDLLHVIIDYWGSEGLERPSWNEHEQSLPHYGESEFKGYFRD